MNLQANGAHLPKLGFGLMRLPFSAGAQIDQAQVRAMVDRFLAAGFTYFDTAYPYLSGMSEVAAREALVERHPRERFLLADKMPVWLLDSEQDLAALFGTQLARTGARYFDYYLVHAVESDKLKKLDALRVWDFLRARKDDGLARRIGFSFHDTADVLKRVLDAHPETEFVQLQINYADWESPAVQSRKCYEVCVERDIPVIVMEPVKGGLLSDLPDAARAVLERRNPKASCASWAMRYAASLPGVSVVLSGMSTLAQMEDNIAALGPAFAPLTDAERTALGEAQQIMNAVETIPCTGCGYCVEGCPAHIHIPSVFDAFNNGQVYGLTPTVLTGYRFATQKADAADCLGCGACEAACPQHIDISARMRAIAARFAPA